MSNELIDSELVKVQRTIKINGVNFDEHFLANLIAEHLAKQPMNRKPTITDAFKIYIKENPSSTNWKFVAHATRNFNSFKTLYGDLTLDDLSPRDS